MKTTKFAAVAALSIALVAGQAAHAGGLAEPILEAEVIAEETSDTSGFVIPLIFLAIIAAVLLIDGGGDGGGMMTGGGGGLS